MLYLSRLLFLLINIDSETVLNWFGIRKLTNQTATSNSNEISFDTFRLIMEGLWEKIQDGLSLADIENILFFILFTRFVILSIRYNLKTSFYITCIGLFAGYLWYRHLIDLISMYRNVLMKLPFLHNLGMDAVQLVYMHRKAGIANLNRGENIHWYNLGQTIYYAFVKGIINIDQETGFRYYIDPISMFMSKLKGSNNSTIIPIYYKVYNKIIPKIYSICSKFWTQLSGIAAYAVITRIGKRYCPYLVRWHWTFLLIIGMVEQIFIYFIYRAHYFQTFVLIPQTKISTNPIDLNLLLQINIANSIIVFVVLIHIGLIIFGLFHAVWGQYFYIPFFVENTELHIGPRPKNSIYSGGFTSWQNPNEQNSNRLFPKLWYGWFGRGTKNGLQFNKAIKNLSQKVWIIFKRVRKRFRK